MVKPEKFGHLHLVCHFTVSLGKERQYDTELASLKLMFNIKNKEYKTDLLQTMLCSEEKSFLKN